MRRHVHSSVISKKEPNCEWRASRGDTIPVSTSSHTYDSTMIGWCYGVHTSSLNLPSTSPTDMGNVPTEGSDELATSEDEAVDTGLPSCRRPSQS
jgi:hypothetical protein